MVIKPPVINIYANPLPGVPPIQLTPKVGDLILSHTPTERFPWVCVVNGQPLKREYWRRREIFMGDVVELHPVVQGGGSRSILGIIASIALSVFAPWAAAAMGFTGLGATLVSAGIMLVGTALINALIMPKPATANANDMPQASPTYNVAMAGNQARLGQPIPVGYGRMRSFPDYAAQPYTEFSTETNPDGDEFFYGLYAIGHGLYDIGAVTVGDSDINSFTDLDYRILQPGEQPSLVKATVVTAVEVSGQVLSATQPVGPFVACGPGRRLLGVGIDIVCPRGLCKIDSGSGKPESRSVEIEISYAPINDAYAQTGDWVVLPLQSITAATLTPQRRTFYFDLPDEPRVAIKVRRTSEQSDDQYIYDEVVWAGMHGHLSNVAPLAPTVTHLEVRIRANEQLSGTSQRKIGVVWQRRLRTWSPDGGFTDPVPTRNPMWALLDKWTDSVYGDRLPLDRIDLNSLYAIAQTCEERRDRLDIIFDTRVSSFEADATIGRVCRSSPMRRNGLRSVMRDERQDLPIAAFTPRNVLEGTSSYQYMQVTDETADGVIVEYFDHNFFDWLEIECPQPGKTVMNPADPRYNPALPMMENPVRLQIAGITGPVHAEREGLYQAAANALRRKYCRWQCELEGSLVYFGAPVLFAPVLHNAMQSGDVVSFDEDTLEVGLSEPVVLGPRSAIVFVRPDGQLTTPNTVRPGPDEWTVVLDGYSSLGFGVWTKDSTRERTRFVLLDSAESREMAKMLAIRPRGEQRYEMYAVVENDLIHEVDAHLLGQPDDPDQFEPWPEEPPIAPPSDPSVVRLTDIRIESVGMWAASPATLVMQADGIMRTIATFWTGGPNDTAVNGQWTRGSPTPQPGIGAGFEIQVRTQIPTGFWDNPNPPWGWIDDLPHTEENGWACSDWLPLESDVTLKHTSYPYFNGRLSIRAVGTESIIADVRLYMKTEITGGA